MKDFQNEVIERSKTIPVVVDFWAPWCGPCKYLGPVIEELAAEAGGKWELVKVNTDENPELSSQYRIQGIPAVKMFFNGEVIAEFTGALPKPQIQKWLEEHIPDERKKALSDILKRLENGSAGDAVEELKQFVAANDDVEEARAVLAKHIALDNPYEAVKLVENIKWGSPYYEPANDIKTLIDLLECTVDDQGVVSDKLKSTQQAALNKDYDRALNDLIEAVMVDKNYCDELPRKAAIAIFHLLGDKHELTLKYRRRFDMALY